MLDNETKRRIDTCRDILVGKVPDPKSQVEQITIALIYKFMDDMDAEAEELGGQRSFFAGDYGKYGWAKLMAPSLGGFDVLNLYSEAIQKMNENPGVPTLFRDILKNAYLPYRDPETLRSFLKEINGFTYDHSERLGDAFEYLLSVLGSQGDAGQFRTPRHIIDFMVNITDPQKYETILDPACGTAGFLISSYKHILKHNSKDYSPQEDREAFDEKGVAIEALTLTSPLHYKGDLLTPDERKQFATNIRGYDISPDMVRLSLVNMYLHGFNDPHIDEYDTLSSDDKWNEFADVIFANPPFMSPKGGIKPHKRFSVQANRSEVLFVDYIAEHLTPNGRAAVIVPEGVIFQSGSAYKQLREMLVNNYLVAVISLPAGVFNPYSGVKTSILVLDKRLAKKTDEILFAKIENDGFNLGAQRRPIDKNDLPAAARNIEAWLESLRNGAAFNVECVLNLHLVAKEKIGENGEWSLSGERYRLTAQQPDQLWPFVELGKVCLKITDGSHYSPETSETGFSYITVKDLDRGRIDLEHCKKIDMKSYNELVKNGCKPQLYDILFSKDGTVGKTAIVSSEKDFVVLSSLAIIRPDTSVVLPNYLYALLSSDLFIDKAIENKTGVAIRRIILRTLKTIQIPLPPLEVQKEIVAETEEYQKIVDGARQVVKNYRPRIHISPDWPLVAIGDLCHLINGRAFKPSDWEQKISGGLPIIRIQNLNSEEAEFNYYTGPVDGKLLVNQGDLLFSWSGSRGTSFGPHIWNREKGVLNQHIFRVIHDERINRKFFYLVLKRAVQEVENNLHGGVGLVHITKGNLERIKVPVPNMEAQLKVVMQIEEEQRLVNANKELVRIFEEKIKATVNRIWGERENIDTLGTTSEDRNRLNTVLDNGVTKHAD